MPHAGASSRAGVRGRRLDALRRTAGAGDLRQARPAGRPAFRGDDLSDTLPRGDAMQQPIIEAVARSARRSACATGRFTPMPSRRPGRILLEVAARPIGGLCARALRFQSPAESAFDNKSAIGSQQSAISLEELLLRHALGEGVAYRREGASAGVMMIPIPKRGIFRRVDGIDAASAVAGIDDLHITAKAESAPGAVARRGQVPGVHLRARDQADASFSRTPGRRNAYSSSYAASTIDAAWVSSRISRRS